MSLRRLVLAIVCVPAVAQRFLQEDVQEPVDPIARRSCSNVVVKQSQTVVIDWLPSRNNESPGGDVDDKPSCGLTSSVDLSQVDLRGISTVRVKGAKARVKYTRLPRGAKPTMTIHTSDFVSCAPHVSSGEDSLVLQLASCRQELENGTTDPTVSGGVISHPLSRWLLPAILALAPQSGPRGSKLVGLMALGLSGAASAEDTCDDEVEIEIGIPDEEPDLTDPAVRVKLLKDLRNASVPDLPTDDPKLGGHEGFAVDPSNYRLYKNGQHRRPTDPATAEEIRAAQGLLFGQAGQVTTLALADTLASDPKGWASAQDALQEIGGMDPAAIGEVSHIAKQNGDPSGGEAYEQFLAYARTHGFDAAHRWLKGQAPLRRNLRWWSVHRTASATPDREHVIAVENAIEAGEKDYDMRRLIHVRMSGGAMAYTDDNTKLWGSELHIAVDVSDLVQPFIAADRIEVYASLLSDSKRNPGTAPLSATDLSYLKAVVHAIYGPSHSGEQRNLKGIYNGDPHNTNGGGAATESRTWSRPFEWLDGEKARSFGYASDEFLFTAQTTELSPSTVPLDGHGTQAGTFMFPVPFSMTYATKNGGAVTGTDPRNTLPESNVGALCFYGRGLTFSETDASTFATIAAQIEARSDANLTALADIVARAIETAWGEDEASPGSGFRPGRLARRPRDGAMVPAIVLKHSYDLPTYVNHATSAALEGKLMGGMKHRDARDNADEFAPPEDAEGKPLYAPNGKPRSPVMPLGSNFKIDGYAVTYSSGVTWKFMLGFDPDAGMTMYHLRMVLPPSRKHPKGKEVPYLYRAYISNFGTDYSASNLGNPNSYLFKESHYEHATGLLGGTTCGGKTLPVFRSKHGAYIGDAFNRPVFYSTYGLDVADPYAKELGFDAPMQAFPLDRSMVDNGLIPQAFCIQEIDLGHNMWHMYTAQHLRGLQISQSTISDAYNVIVNFKLNSDGKFSVGEILHGKPGVGTHVLPGVSGQYTSRGRGGQATNHMHWHVIALEPHLKMDEPRVVNKLQVSDLVSAAEEPSDWFGTAFHRKTSTIELANETDLMNFDYMKQRYWRIAAVNEETGEDLGSLKVTSPLFGPPIHAGNRQSHLPRGETLEGNHWWLRQDIHVVNATNRRDSTVLLTPGTSPGYELSRSVDHPLKGKPKFDRPMVFCSIKLTHEVVEEEMPVQPGFSHIDVNVQPHNLHGINPNILVRQQPEYNIWYENTLMQSYTPPYTSEYEGH
eukprot:TRINITY_DN50125_c0_g1_i1.p1 TRINITY_DN50125_c0_g1~~TRINITY_DN50125_c0_g1_i1.p1  ORF type:complete len:1234 (+),score=177.22 TRINITY_DN50125_c0_g1_i1:63-3764(+)